MVYSIPKRDVKQNTRTLNQIKHRYVEYRQIHYMAKSLWTPDQTVGKHIAFSKSPSNSGL